MTSSYLELREALLSWYDVHGRALPWRRSRDPYAVWVSEIMLQQTRVDTVIPYFERFMARFPSLECLADAHEDDVLAHWSGLGYYRRARLLHKGAREVRERHGGQVPRDPAARLALPGIGRYTAGAIGSIAFELPEPIVDGNVARVLSRVWAIAEPVGRRDVDARLWEEAARLSKGPRPGDLNQALMELGALLCTPTRPACDACPWAARCAARARGLQEELPRKLAKKEPRAVSWVALVARDRAGKVFLRRGQDALFGGLWSPPHVEGEGRAQAERLQRSLALSGSLAKRARKVRHELSHRRLSVAVYRLEDAHAEAAQGLAAVGEAELAQLGVSTLTRKILRAGSASSRRR